MSYWVATIFFFVTWTRNWCVANICINSDIFSFIIDFSFTIFNYTPFYDINTYCSSILELCFQISLSCLLDSQPHSFFTIVSRYAISLCHLIPILAKTFSTWLMTQFSKCYLWISYCCYHLFPLTWLSIAKFNRYPIELLNIRLSHLASYYSYYISWFKMPFKFVHWSSPSQVISLDSIPFCPQYCSLISLNIVLLVQIAFSYSLSIDLSLLMPLPFTFFHSSQFCPQYTLWYEVIYLCIL